MKLIDNSRNVNENPYATEPIALPISAIENYKANRLLGIERQLYNVSVGLNKLNSILERMLD